MKILFVDTTTADLVCAVVCDNEIFVANTPGAGTHHSELLCNAVQDVLVKANTTFDELSAYACAIGPGSFTGIRIGISTVKGYCTAVPKPYIAVNCLQAICISARCGAKGSAVIDAGNGYYYADSAQSPCLIAYDDVRAQSAGRGSATDYFDGAVQLIRSRFCNGQLDGELVPLYIRRSQAEENRK